MKTRIISMLCALAMLLCLLPTGVFAANAPEFSGTCGEAITWELDPTAGLLTIEGEGAMPDYTYSYGAPWYTCRARIFNVVIGEGITAIGDYAFNECNLLVTVDASACTLTAIGEGAMSGCALLESVTFIPGDTLTVGADAFYGCASLQALDLSAKEGEIGTDAFAGCIALAEVKLPESLSGLKRGTFDGCTSLTALTIPENVEYIGVDCFRNCTGLTELSFPAALRVVERRAFNSCNPLILTFAGDAPMFAPLSDSTASFPADSILRTPYEAEGWGWPIFKGYTTESLFPSLTEVFRDVPEDAWYLPSVQRAYYMGLMNGVREGEFAPNNPMTRGELVTVLYRAAGSPEIDVENPFTDVAENSFYYDAVRWAQANGIVTGVNATTFKPTDRINRQQIATILYRYAASLELDLSQRDPLTDFVDVSDVASYAKDPMSWCVAIGLINGKPGGKLDPNGTATRAEVAKILTGFVTYLAAEDILSQDDWLDDYIEPEPGPEIDREDPAYLYAREIFDGINKKRTETGLSELEWNDSIYLAAVTRAEELTRENGFSHTRPNGANYSTVFEEFNIECTTRNEIIARGYTSAQALVDAWASTGSSSPVISAVVYSNAAVGVYQMPAEEGEEAGRYYYVLLVAG
ncbi:MAG: hypothetical protein E7464_08450 [Ruminococcaceae bacterium]|nr:hypothetical protein [Oscillospiraceae bacterium]